MRGQSNRYLYIRNVFTEEYQEQEIAQFCANVGISSKTAIKIFGKKKTPQTKEEKTESMREYREYVREVMKEKFLSEKQILELQQSYTLKEIRQGFWNGGKFYVGDTIVGDRPLDMRGAMAKRVFFHDVIVNILSQRKMCRY